MNESDCAGGAYDHPSFSRFSGGNGDVLRESAGPCLSRVPSVFYAWLVGFFALWSLRATVVFDAVDAHIGPIPRAVQSHALSFFVWVLPALFVGRQVFGSGFATVLRLAPVYSDGADGIAARRAAYRSWIIASVAIGMWFAGWLAFEHVTSGRHLSFDTSSLLRLTASLSLVPIGEEIVFRGLILSVIERRSCVYQANLITSILFVLIHLPSWISSSIGHPGAVDEVALRGLQIFVLSLFLGALTIRTRSIWPAVVAHMINSAIVVLLA